jgi:hypothetical protein
MKAPDYRDLDYYAENYTSFCIKIRTKGNESLIADMKALATQKKLTSELIKAFKKRSGHRQLFLDL